MVEKINSNLGVPTLLILLSIFSGCVTSSTPGLKQEIEQVLQDHPELVIQVLEERDIRVFELAQRGAEKKGLQAEKERRLNEYAHPFQPIVESTRPIRGNPESQITIVEYSDFQCPFCRKAYSTVKDVLKKYDNRVKLVYKHNPLPIYELALPTAQYFEAIALQSHEQAWLFHDLVFEQQEMIASGGEMALKAIVESLTIDQQKLSNDLKSKTLLNQIEKDRMELKSMGLSGTPIFLINGVSLRGAYPEKDFSEIIDKFLSKTPHLSQ